MATTIQLSLKKFTHNARLSEETYNFAAVVCIDGKPVFEASNHGTGGCHNYHSLSTTDASRATMSAALKQIEEYAASLPASIYHGVELKHDTDWVVSDLVTAALEEKAKAKFGRALAKKIHFIRDGKLYTLGLGAGVTVTPDAIKSVGAKYPTAKILNGLPLDEAWQNARKHLGFGNDTND